MKNIRNYKISILVIVLIICIWTLWPRSFKKIIPLNIESISEISLQTTEFGTIDSSLSINVYDLDIESADNKNYEYILDILKNTKFCSDFRNLLPWNITTVDSGSKSITHSAIIRLMGSDSEDMCYINFHGDRTVSIDSKYDSEFKIYHPTNKQTLYQLAEYIKKNGINKNDITESGSIINPEKEECKIILDGTVFTYNDVSYDFKILKDLELANLVYNLYEYEIVGDHILVFGSIGKNAEYYAIFNPVTQIFEKGIASTHFIYKNDDIKTAVYSNENCLYNYDDSLIKEIALSDDEYIYNISYDESGENVVVDIVQYTSDESLRKEFIPLYSN